MHTIGSFAWKDRIRGVPGFKIASTSIGLNEHLREYLDPFEGNIK